MHYAKIGNLLQSFLCPALTRAFHAELYQMAMRSFDRDRIQPDDFLAGEGVKTFNAISMRLQVIGELLKAVEKTGILEKYTEIDWSEIIKLRELISHHYDKLEHEIIFNICKDSIPELRQMLVRILADLKNE